MSSSIIMNNPNSRTDGFSPKSGELSRWCSESRNPLVLSRQYDENPKYEDCMSYRRFDNETSLYNFIKNPSNNNTNLFEMIIDDTPKLYFDIDKVNMTKDEVKILQDKLTKYLIYSLNIPESVESVVWVRREEEKKKYKSIHINYPYCRTTKDNLKIIVGRWNDNNVVQLDTSVYNKNRAWSMPYNCKAKYHKKREFRLLKINESININKSNINIRFIGSHYDLCEIYSLTSKYKIQNIFIPKQVECWIKCGVNNVKNQINVDTNKCLITNNTSTIKSITHSVNKHSIIKILIMLVEQERINDTMFMDKLWIRLTQQLILNDVDDIGDWLKYSADRSGGKYSLNDNMKYKDKCIKEPKFKGHIQKHLDTINHLNGLVINYKWTDDINSDKLDWLSDKTGLPTEIIRNQISTSLDVGKDVKSPKVINFCDNKFSWDFNRLLLYNNVNKTTTIYNSKIYKKLYGVDFDNGWIKSSVQELSTISIDWINNKKTSIMAVNAKWGTGKTHYCLNSLIEDTKKTKTRTLIITENNNLNLEYASKFDGVSHKDTSNFCEEQSLIICSLESIYKLEDWDFSIVVLDEYESLLNHYESDTMDSGGVSGYYKMSVMFDKIRNADKVIALDADLTDTRLDILLSLRNETLINKQYITENRWESYTHNIYHNDRENFLNDLMIDLNNNKKIILPTSSKTFGNAVYKMIEKKYPNKIIGLINGNGIKVRRDGEEITSINKKDMMDDLTSWLENADLDLFIHSPSIKTGVSINKCLFDKVYGNVNENSCCVREFIQMLYRCRETGDEEINILCEYHSGEYLKTDDTDTIKCMIVNNIEFKIQSKNKFQNTIFVPFSLDVDYYKNTTTKIGIKTNPLYLQVRSINLEETEKTRSGMIHELIGRLEYNHNIKLIHKYQNTDEFSDDMITEYKECAEDIRNKEILEFLNCDIINDSEERRLRQKQEKNDTNNPLTDKELKLINKYFEMRKIGVGGYYKGLNGTDVKDYNRLYDDENNMIYDTGSISQSYTMDKTKTLEEQMTKEEYDKTDWENTKMYPFKNADGLVEKDSTKMYYIKSSQYDYRKVINDNWKNKLKLNKDIEPSKVLEVVKGMMNRTNTTTMKSFREFIKILTTDSKYNLDDIVSGELDDVITEEYKSVFSSLDLKNDDMTKNQLYILKYFWKMLKLDLYNKVEITNKKLTEVLMENAEFIQKVASKDILVVYPTEKYLTNFNPMESSHIKKFKTFLKKLLKLIGYGYDYVKYKKVDEDGKRIYNKHTNRPNTIMYFSKDLEFGFSGSIRLTNNNNDNDKLPEDVYNVGLSEINKKGRGVYYKGIKMYKLNNHRYINYKPTDIKTSYKPTDKSITETFNLVLKTIDLGVFYGYNMKYYVENLGKVQQDYHIKYNEKYGDKYKCLISEDYDDYNLKGVNDCEELDESDSDMD